MWGSGRIASREYAFSGFTAIRAAKFDVEIIQSHTFGVTVRADDNVINRLVVRKSGDTLVLGTKPWFWFFGALTVEATVKLPELDSLTLSGAASASVNNFRAGRLDVVLSGASELDGSLQADAIDFVASGASRARLSGTAGRVTIDGSGASNLRLDKMTIGSAEIELSGASRADVNVTTAIESVNASGASRLRYRGDPRLGHIETSGASRVARA